MGWSATARACFALDYIRDTVSLPLGSSNALPGGGFYEVGREHDDGRVTGTVYRPVSATHVRKAGSFLISADGVVVRFPKIPKGVRAAATAASAARYAATYGEGA